MTAVVTVTVAVEFMLSHRDCRTRPGLGTSPGTVTVTSLSDSARNPAGQATIFMLAPGPHLHPATICSYRRGPLARNRRHVNLNS